MYILCKTHVHYRWQINIAVLVNMPKTETKLQCCSHFVDQHTRLNTAKLTFKKNLKSASLREHGGEDMKATQEKRGSTRGSRSYKPKAILISQVQPVALMTQPGCYTQVATGQSHHTKFIQTMSEI